MKIHSTAIVEKQVELDSDIEIGAYSVIRGKVRIGNGTEIKDHVTIYGPLTMGNNNTIHPGAVLGNISQDLKYGGEETEVIIGNQNSIRECVTIQQGTAGGNRKTILGDNNFIMAYTHIAHDCLLGNNIIIANSTQLAGHIIVNDYAYIGGIVGIHQFVTIGSYCFIGFLSRINRDAPPFVIVEGNPARERGLNIVGLKRRNFTVKDIDLLKNAFRELYVTGKTHSEKIQILTEGELAKNQHVQQLLTFIKASAAGKNGRALEARRK